MQYAGQTPIAMQYAGQTSIAMQYAGQTPIAMLSTVYSHQSLSLGHTPPSQPVLVCRGVYTGVCVYRGGYRGVHRGVYRGVYSGAIQTTTCTVQTVTYALIDSDLHFTICHPHDTHMLANDTHMFANDIHPHLLHPRTHVHKE